MTDLSPAITMPVPVPAGALTPDVMDAVLAGIPASTRRAYASDWARFTGWCAAAGHTPLPATGETLAAYEKHLAYEWVPPRKARRPAAGDTPRGMAPASIIRSRAAILKMHKLAGFARPDTELAISVMRGYTAGLAENRDPRANPRKASAARLEDLELITGTSARTSLLTLRNRAMILLGYGTGARASELAFLNIKDITILPVGLSVSVYRSKVRKRKEVVIQARHAPQTIAVVTEWLDALRAAGRTQGPLFVQISKGGRILVRIRRDGTPLGDPQGRILPQVANRVLRKHADAAKLPGTWSWHALRRGMATNARTAGHDNISIARQGGWAPNSVAMAEYMDDADKWGDDNALRGAAL